MKKELFWWEWKKLWSVPMFTVFLVLCMAFNAFIAADALYGQKYVSYVSDVTEETGRKMGASFDKKLADSPGQEYKDILMEETKGEKDIFETYQAENIFTVVKNIFPVAKGSDEVLNKKYKRLQKSIDLLEEQDASLDVDAAGMTDDLLNCLFGKLCRAVITESWMLAAFMAIYLGGCEKLSKTASTVFSTKMGRKLQHAKYAASLFSGLISYLLLAVSGIGAYCCLWDLDSVWGGSISSQFHHRKIAVFNIPFITWKPFTVGEYLAAMMLLGIIVLFVFHAVSFGIGMVSGNAYWSFLILSGMGIFCFLANIFSGNGTSFLLHQLTEWNPIMFWWKQYKWFTDMDVDSVLPWQECLEAAVCTGMAAGILWLCRRYFDKKDIL